MCCAPPGPGLRGPRAASTDVISPKASGNLASQLHSSLCNYTNTYYCFSCDLIHPLFRLADFVYWSGLFVLCFALLD